MSFPTLGPTSHPGQICSCIMLMNFTLMRNPSAMFMPSTLLPDTQHSSLAVLPFARGISDGIPSPVADETVSFDPYNPFFADQGIFHVIWLYRPTMFRHLSLRWDVSTCRQQLGISLGSFGDELEEDMSEEDQLGRQLALEGSGEEHTLMSPGILHLYVAFLNFRVSLLTLIPTVTAKTRTTSGYSRRIIIPMPDSALWSPLRYDTSEDCWVFIILILLTYITEDGYG